MLTGTLSSIPLGSTCLPDIHEQWVDHLCGGQDVCLWCFWWNAVWACCLTGLQGLDGFADLGLGWWMGVHL